MREQAGEYYRETLKKNLSAFGSSLLLNRHFQQTRIGGEKVVKEFYTGKGTNWKANGFKFLIPSLADFESANSRQRRPKEIGVGSLSVRRDRRMVEEGTDARTVAASAESAPARSFNARNGYWDWSTERGGRGWPLRRRYDGWREGGQGPSCLIANHGDREVDWLHHVDTSAEAVAKPSQLQRAP